MSLIGPVELIIILFIFIIPLIGMWKIFNKASKPGWTVLVPFYNIIVFLEIIEKPWWWLFLYFIPYFNLIWIIWGLNLLAKKFGKSETFALGLILFTPIFIPILGFGDSKYSKRTLQQD